MTVHACVRDDAMQRAEGSVCGMHDEAQLRGEEGVGDPEKKREHHRSMDRDWSSSGVAGKKRAGGLDYDDR